MRLWKIILVALVFTSCSNEEIFAQEPQNLREEVIVENQVFKVWYNEVYEQPMKLVYTSTNRVKNVDRGSMNFYTVDGYHTSDNKDYTETFGIKDTLLQQQPIRIQKKI